MLILMILIFDTFSGLCNQFMDINCAINFCLINNVKFSFRYCSFRENDLISFNNKPFTELFNIDKIREDKICKEKFNSLYINFDKLIIEENNTFNFNNTKRCIELFDNSLNLLTQFENIKKKYIIMKQFWPIYNLKYDFNIYKLIQPSLILLNYYNNIKSKLPKNYNCIHYRFESDFCNYFKLKVDKLENLLCNYKFKNTKIKTYIATSNIEQSINFDTIKLKIEYGTNNNKIDISNKFKNINIIPKGDINRYNIIGIDPCQGIVKSIFIDGIEYSENVEINLIDIRKNYYLYKKFNNSLINLNYEQSAFIDFLICINSVEFVGHKKSSFSTTINQIKNTDNYY